jgi:hypothetical protein
MLDRIIRFRYNTKKGSFNDDTIITMSLNIIQREEIILEMQDKSQVEKQDFSFNSHYKSYNPYGR